MPPTNTTDRPAANQMTNGANGASNIQAASPEPKKEKVTTQVLAQVERLRAQGSLTLPANYNVGNALTSAWLKLQTVENKDHRSIIKGGQVDQAVVTLTSVANALHDYAIQGLNCSKNQAYFIVYGNSLVCQRSYFGDMLVAERARPGIKFYFDTIRKEEEFRIAKTWSNSEGLISTVESHATPFPRDPEIVGAYCGVVDTKTGENLGMSLMDIDRIRRSWAMSKVYSANGSGTHNKFPEEMALRTVIRHRCKSIINSSSDALLMEAMRRQQDDMIEAEVAEDADLNGNGETLSLPAPQSTEPLSLNGDGEGGESQEGQTAMEAGF